MQIVICRTKNAWADKNEKRCKWLGEELVHGRDDYIGETEGVVGAPAKEVFLGTTRAGLNGLLIWRLGRRAILAVGAMRA
jgi:hypothetical protein